MAPKGVPSAIVSTLTSELQTLLADAEFRAQMAAKSTTPSLPSGPEEMARVIRMDTGIWSALVSKAAIKLE